MSCFCNDQLEHNILNFFNVKFQDLEYDCIDWGKQRAWSKVLTLGKSIIIALINIIAKFCLVGLSKNESYFNRTHEN